MEKEENEKRGTILNLDSIDHEINALLADLQTNLNKGGGANNPTVTLYPSTPNEVVISTKNPSAKSYTVIHDYQSYPSVPPKTPNGENDVDVPSPLENQRMNGVSHGAVTPSTVSSFSTNAVNCHTYQNQQPNEDPMYRHETREESREQTRTESRSSGPRSASTVPRGAGGNLSDLDSLLSDLNSTRKTATFKERSMVNGSRPTVDSLLDDLNKVGNRDSYEKHQEYQSSAYAYPQRISHTSASNATRELDDLMDSLSDFKINKDTAYAKPLPKRRSLSPPPKPKPQPPPPEPPVQPPPTNQLDSMLGTLTSHMTEQGITTSQKGSCCACEKPIVGQVITALGKTWHPEHFVCHYCKSELGTKNFFERDGKPYCEPDYHNLFSPKCAYCESAILDKCVTAMNKTWHPEHFFCAQCGNTFGEEGFHEKNGKPYCKHDYFNMFAPKCGGCANPIMENYISALNAQWHPNCFVCRDCNQPFNGGSFFNHEGLPYCETHYHAKRGSLCAACNKPITGRCITAMFKKFHPEHFLCSFCLQQLNKGTFKEENNKPYCRECFDKLYG